MNITDKNTLKSWFLRGMKPLESQFAAWIDAYWHKSEQIPTSSIDGLEATLNSKAEAADIRNLTNEFATHRDDNTRHKTAEEQAKLNNLANNANLTYATKEEISILLDNGAIIIPIDFTKTKKERAQEAQNVWLKYLPNYAGKPFYILFKWFESGDSTKILTELALCKQPRVYDDDSEGLTEAEATLALPILTQDNILAGSTTPKSRRIKLFVDSKEIYISEIAFDTLVPIKSFNLYFFPEEKFSWDWAEYCEAYEGQEVSGTLTRYGNEGIFACDKWDDLYTFMKYDKVNENRIPPIYLSTITSGEKELFKPAIIEARTQTIGGTRNEITGFKLRTCSLEEINGKKCLLEETLNIPIFTGCGSPYTYKFTITPCNAEHEDNSAIIIPVDFTKGTTNLVADLVKLIQPFFDDGTIYKKPVYLQYIYKDDYATPDAPLKYCLVPKTKETRTVILTEYYFNSSVSVSEPDYPEYKDAYCFLFRLTKTNVSVSMRGYTEDVPVEAIYLTENGDYQVDTSDKNWFKLRDELNKGNRPLLSLKTPESGVYCPVTYEFTPVTPATTPVSYQGKMEISYLKETDGVMEMWVETRIFTNFYGAGVYDYPHIKKYPCKPDVRVVTEYPTDLSGVADGTIFIKNPGAV